jgi:hypothetical protein
MRSSHPETWVAQALGQLALRDYKNASGDCSCVGRSPAPAPVVRFAKAPQCDSRLHLMPDCIIRTD